MTIATTIIPIFVVILVGLVIQRRNFFPPEFSGPANRLVYYVAIPAMIFGSVAKSDFTVWFSPLTIGITLLSAATIYLTAGLAHRYLDVDADQVGTFIQSAGHGNIGYMGLAVATYYLGDIGLAHASVIGGFLMILQNILSVTALSIYAAGRRARPARFSLAGKIMGNPVILAVLTGMVFSIGHIALPVILQRSLKIISDLALPMALLLIGGSLSFGQVRKYWKISLFTTVLKLLALPGVGFALFTLFGISGNAMTAAIILMGCPTATITYVMSKQMYGDFSLATASITLSTLASALTLSFWLKLVPQ
jgi:predicted permease